ncbi:MAG: EAL domain-containing protein [Spirochaetaceae bacterium]|nr:EAL domain-containing protein [Spirochaetaceae bacterium]
MLFSVETNKIRTLAWSCMGVLFFLQVLLIGINYFTNKNLVEKKTKHSLELVSIVAAQAAETRITDPLNYMAMIAKSYAKTESPIDFVNLIKKNDDKSLFLDIYWVEKDGTFVSTSEIDFELSEIQEYISEVFAGTPLIKYFNNIPLGQESVFYGVPIILDKTTRAILLARTTPQILANYILKDVIKLDTDAFIINHNGDLVASTVSLKDMSNEQQKIQKDWIKEQLEKETGFAVIKYKNNNGKDFFLSCTPIRDNRWYLITSIEILDEYIALSIIFAMVCFLVIITFGAMIIVIINRNTNYRYALEKTLYTDPVTGGISYTNFERLVREKLKDTKPNVYSFISLDIHNFKLINDVHGGGGGNATLVHIHSMLRKYLDKDDLMCRVDADLFNILTKTKPIEEINDFFEKFATDLNSFNDKKKDKYFLKIKAGIYIIPGDQQSLMAIRDRSNIARKMAKNQHTTKLYTFAIFDESELLRQTREREFENTMEQSLKNHEFKMYLQPKINIQTGKIAGAEALVRWDSPVYGMIQPNSFIPMFERNGFIIQIDLDLFKQVCIFLKERIDNNLEPINISVNLSRIHLYNPNFLDDFIKIQEQYNIPPKYLEFEITESVAFEQLDAMEECINKIHEAGFTCSIDDFGSGYSSLNSLGDIPADVLKLDKTFFKVDSHQKIRNKHIITSVISLAKQLDMKVVAEGIETSSQAHFLQNIECDIIQGFIYSRPLPVAAFKEFLETWSDDIFCQTM